MPLKHALVTNNASLAPQTNGRIIETNKEMPFGRVSIPYSGN
jgi:hypothetical protein